MPDMKPEESRVKIHHCKDRSEEQLSEYDIPKIDGMFEHGLRECWYWYASGSYDGSGCILMRGVAQDGTERWCQDDLGHCSCYGPTENISFGTDNARSWTSLDALALECGTNEDVQPLVEMALVEHPPNPRKGAWPL